MRAELKAELKKVLTIRSTYIIFLIIVILVGFFGFYVAGWHSSGPDLLNPTRYFQTAKQAINFLSILVAFIGVLLLTHEYRYNVAAYTLTLANHRYKVLVSKVVVVIVVALVMTAFIGTLSPLLARLGIDAHHLHLVPQHFYYWDLVWRGLAYGVGYSLFGLVIAGLVKNQIGAIATLLIWPRTVEGLFSLWLKNDTVYMPFSALQAMLGTGTDLTSGHLAPIHALEVVVGYVLFGGAVAWYLFLVRDVG